MGILYTKTTPDKSRPKYPEYKTLYLASELKPKNNGWINVINDFPWTLTPTSSEARKETPSITLTEYYMVDSALNQQLLPYGITATGNNTSLSDLIKLSEKEIGGNIKQLYEGLYDRTNPSEFKYFLPFFTQNSYSVSNSWEGKDLLDTMVDYQNRGIGSAASAVTRAISRFGSKRQKTGTGSKAGGGVDFAQFPEIVRQVNMLNLQMKNPAVGLFDAPHVWRTSAPREYTFNFYLYNIETTNNTSKDIQNLILRNWELCYLLTYQNAINKRNFFTVLPPVYYEVQIPGVHYCKASIMKSINISNIGNIRTIKLPFDDGPENPVNIPDAYMIEITMQDLLMPSKNLYSAVRSASIQNVISKSLSSTT